MPLKKRALNPKINPLVIERYCMKKNKDEREIRQRKKITRNNRLEKYMTIIVVYGLTVGAILIAGRYYNRPLTALAVCFIVVTAIVTKKNFFKVIVSPPYLILYSFVTMAVVASEYVVPFVTDIFDSRVVEDSFVYGGFAVFGTLALISLIVVKIQKRSKE